MDLVQEKMINEVSDRIFKKIIGASKPKTLKEEKEQTEEDKLIDPEDVGEDEKKDDDKEGDEKDSIGKVLEDAIEEVSAMAAGAVAGAPLPKDKE